MNKTNTKKSELSKQADDLRTALFKHHPATIWLTGFSGAGKSTIAFQLEHALLASGHACYVLDGDVMRHGLTDDLGFSADDRKENIRRAAHVARLMNDAGVFVIAAFISPYRADRYMAKQIIGADRFVESWIAASLEKCEQRDVKGLYKKARAGEIVDFTGVSAPYEIPLDPDITIASGTLSVELSVNTLFTFIRDKHWL